MDAYNKIAYLKVVKKQIDKEISELESKLRAKERKVSLGKFVRTQTQSIQVDKNKLLKSITKQEFIDAAGFTKTSLNNTLDKQKFAVLEKKKIISFVAGKDALKFYTDKSIQLPNINISITNGDECFEYAINP